MFNRASATKGLMRGADRGNKVLLIIQKHFVKKGAV